MQKNLKLNDVTLTPEIESHLDRKLESISKFYSEESDSAVAHITLGDKSNQHQSGDIFTAKIQLQLLGKEFRGTAREETLLNAIDEASSNLETELRRSKKKRLDFIKKGGAKIKKLLRRE